MQSGLHDKVGGSARCGNVGLISRYCSAHHISCTDSAGFTPLIELALSDSRSHEIGCFCRCTRTWWWRDDSSDYAFCHLCDVIHALASLGRSGLPVRFSYSCDHGVGGLRVAAGVALVAASVADVAAGVAD